MSTSPSVEFMIETSCDDEQIQVDIIDKGRGISPELRDNLFEPFQTASSGGMGIGPCRSPARSSKRIMDGYGQRPGRVAERLFPCHCRFSMRRRGLIDPESASGSPGNARAIRTRSKSEN